MADTGNLTLPQTVDADIEVTVPADHAALDVVDVLRVYTGPKDACCAGRLPMSGRYSVDGNQVTFDPAFDLIAGQTYTVLSSDQGADIDAHLTEFSIAGQNTTAPQVLAIYPVGDMIPENTLRFYVHFATPMQPHRSTEFIALVDQEGVADDAAFMAFKQELWSEDRRRLTVLMDPGRIKRGVAQNLTLGPALESGKIYTLVIKAGWPSVHGEAVAPRFEQTFTVAPPLRTRADTALWQIAPPKTGTRSPLAITFDRPFDYQLVQTNISVLDAGGQIISGVVSVSDAGTLWEFIPQTKWIGSQIKLSVDARLEDVAGNNFRERLDHPIGDALRDIDETSLMVVLQPPN